MPSTTSPSTNSGDDIARELDALSSQPPTSRPSWPASRAASQPQAIEAGDGDILEPADEQPVQRPVNEGGTT